MGVKGPKKKKEMEDVSQCNTMSLAAGNKKLNGQKVSLPSLAQLCNVDCS